MEINYCSECRIRVSSYDIEEGKGIEHNGEVYCETCARKLGLIGRKKAETSSKKQGAKVSSEAEKRFDRVSKHRRTERQEKGDRRRTDRRGRRSMPGRRDYGETTDDPRAERRAGRSGPRKNESSPLVPILIAAGAVLLLIILIILFSAGNKTNTSGQTDDTAGTSSGGQQAAEDKPAGDSRPQASPDTAQTDEDTMVLIDVLKNDSDPDNDTLRVLNTGVASYGSVVNRGSRVKYTPRINYHGTDTFVYTITDSQGNTARSSVTVRIKPVNDPPEIKQKSVATTRGASVPVFIQATDPDEDELTYTIVTGPGHGKLTGTAPNFKYIPADDFTGRDSFIVKASDGTVDSSAVTVTINVKESSDTADHPDNAKKEEDPEPEEENIEEEPEDTVPVVVPEGKIDIKINFQPRDEKVPAGYLKDSGEVFGNRGNGYSYGWSEEMLSKTRKRNKNENILLDTVMVIPRKSQSVWEIALPAGTYSVTISIGDASGSWQGISAEQTVFWKSEYLAPGTYAKKTETVKVTDGRVTLKQGDERGLWSRLNFIEIKTVRLDK